MNEIQISDETARKIILGLEGDKKMRAWALDYLTGQTKYRNRKRRIFQLAEEWMQQLIRERWWGNDKFAHMKKMCLENNDDNKGHAIDEQVHHMMEGMSSALQWEDDVQAVVWSRFYHNDAPWPMEKTDLPEFLGYINEHLNE